MPLCVIIAMMSQERHGASNPRQFDYIFFQQRKHQSPTFLLILKRNHRWCRKRFHDIDGLAQDWSNSIANALELLQFCTKASTWCDHDDVIKWIYFRITGPLWGEPPIIGGLPSKRLVARKFDVFFDLRLNKRLSKQSRCRWFETPSRSLWRHCNDHVTLFLCFQLHPIILQSMHNAHPAAPPHRQFSGQSRFDPTYARTADPYNASSSLSSNQDELMNIFIETGSQTYENPTNLRNMAKRRPSLNAHGGASNYMSPAPTTPPYPQTYSLHQPTPGGTLRRPAPGNVSLDSMTILDPQLLQALLEDVRMSSPDVYQRYVKPGNVAAIAVPTREDTEARFAFDNMGFVDESGNITDGMYRQGHGPPDTDSGVAVDPTGSDPNRVLQRSPFVYNHGPHPAHSPEHEPFYLSPRGLQEERDKSLYLVDAGTDTVPFAPVRPPKGTPSVSPTLSHSPHNESHSSGTQTSSSPPPPSGADPLRPKPKVPARPSKAAIQQSAFSQPIPLQQQDRPRPRLSPTSVDTEESQSTVWLAD